MNRFKSLVHDRVPEGVMTKRWHAVAYRDHRTMQTVTVIWPFHWVVLFVWWLGFKWDKHRHRRSWIDKIVDAARESDRNSDVRQFVRKMTQKTP